MKAKSQWLGNNVNNKPTTTKQKGRKNQKCFCKAELRMWECLSWPQQKWLGIVVSVTDVSRCIYPVWIIQTNGVRPQTTDSTLEKGEHTGVLSQIAKSERDNPCLLLLHLQFGTPFSSERDDPWPLLLHLQFGAPLSSERDDHWPLLLHLRFGAPLSMGNVWEFWSESPAGALLRVI